MNQWHQLYHPTPADCWQGRVDGIHTERFHQIVERVDLRKPLNVPTSLSIMLIGFCCDIGVRRNQGRPGAHQGPQALRTALTNLAVHTTQAIIYDAGNIVCHSDDLEQAQRALAHAVQAIVQQGYFPMVLGGGHETAWGHYQGLEMAGKAEQLQILNIDAHLDLRDTLNNPTGTPGNMSMGTSGSSFWQIYQQRVAQGLPFHYTCYGVQPYANTPSLLTRAREINTKIWWASDIHQNASQYMTAALREIDHTTTPIYLSICLDAFASCFAPGVSAPQINGLFLQHVQPIIDHLARKKRLVSVDIVELSPYHDSDQRTAKLAAHLLLSLTHSLLG